jgi:hypothetical protein
MEAWLYSDASVEEVFGEALYLDLIAADYRDRYVVACLRERLFEWARVFLPRKWQPVQLNEIPAIDLGNGSIRRVIPTGYCHTGEGSDLPHPRDFVDESWDGAERARVIGYLDSAYIMLGYVGFSWCRMGCPGAPEDIGTRDLTDGTWVFPEGLVHYVRHLYVKPEAAFVEHVRRIGYRMPDLPLKRNSRPWLAARNG